MLKFRAPRSDHVEVSLLGRWAEWAEFDGALDDDVPEARGKGGRAGYLHPRGARAEAMNLPPAWDFASCPESEKLTMCFVIAEWIV
jgi:hypothetical protein